MLQATSELHYLSVTTTKPPIPLNILNKELINLEVVKFEYENYN